MGRSGRPDLCRAELPALTVAGVGDAGHFLPADAPEAIARALGDRLRTFDE
ncbi:hypothetical protein [Dactylosporangium sp. NPDC049140]|uniref:hypothetical protein n=1 Tax=Dactylosporangium sp. NPDC049140 TaxID=3155647 RepID=UPI0033C4CFB5